MDQIDNNGHVIENVPSKINTIQGTSISDDVALQSTDICSADFSRASDKSSTVIKVKVFNKSSPRPSKHQNNDVIVENEQSYSKDVSRLNDPFVLIKEEVEDYAVKNDPSLAVFYIEPNDFINCESSDKSNEDIGYNHKKRRRKSRLTVIESAPRTVGFRNRYEDERLRVFSTLEDLESAIEDEEERTQTRFITTHQYPKFGSTGK